MVSSERPSALVSVRRASTLLRCSSAASSSAYSSIASLLGNAS